MKKWLVFSLLCSLPLFACNDEASGDDEEDMEAFEIRKDDEIHAGPNPIIDYPSKRDDNFLDTLMR